MKTLIQWVAKTFTDPLSRSALIRFLCIFSIASMMFGRDTLAVVYIFIAFQLYRDNPEASEDIEDDDDDDDDEGEEWKMPHSRN